MRPIADCGLRIVDLFRINRPLSCRGEHSNPIRRPIAVTPEQLKQRTKKFGIRTVKVVEKLPARRTALTIGRQLLRSGTSVGANYRAACRARSDAEFRAKLGICEEEADETIYWLEMIVELGYIRA
jgi:four helix bundle protein